MKSKIYQGLVVTFSTISLLVILEVLSSFYVREEVYKEFDTLFKSPCFNNFSEQPKIQKDIYKESIDNKLYLDELGYQLRNFNGKYQNVRDGIRKTCYKNSDSTKKLYLFGGSTVEGVGVSDCETIPSYLQKDLTDFEVVNMGVRGNFSVTEERRLKKLSPEKGAVVIFLDGLNDNFYELEEVDIFKNSSGLILGIKNAVNELDLYKAMKIYFRVKKESKSIKESEYLCVPKSSSEKIIYVNKEMKISTLEIAKRYLDTKRSIEKYCEQKKIDCIFIAQPVPSYRYSQNLYFYDTEGGFSNRQAEYGEFIKEITRDERVMDLSGALDEVEKAYVDKVHYSSYANKVIAREISRAIKKNEKLN